MIKFTDFIIPLFICAVIGLALIKKLNVFEIFINGAQKGLNSAAKLLPTFIILLTAIGMFKASGALDMLIQLLFPVAKLIGLPSELLPIAILRPLSGSGSIALFKNIADANSPDGKIVRIAAVMLSSTETTFYTIAVYFGATKVKRLRFTLIAALIGDIAVIVLSPIIVNLLFP